MCLCMCVRMCAGVYVFVRSCLCVGACEFVCVGMFVYVCVCVS